MELQAVLLKTMAKYNLVGVDGNAFSIMGYVTRAMKEARCDRETIDNYLKDAKSSDYDHLLMVSVEMIQFCNEQCGIYDDEDDFYIYDEDVFEDYF